jgi:hypothetical protein
VPAILWVLETSTNPETISAAAAMAVDLQWPIDLDLRAAMDRLHHASESCFTSHLFQLKVRQGLLQDAINYGQAYCVLAICSPEEIRRREEETFLESYRDMSLELADSKSTMMTELQVVFSVLKGSTLGFRGSHASSVLNWAIHVLPDRLIYPGVDMGLELANFLENFRPDRLQGLTERTYADYLLCMNVLLGFQPHRRDLARSNRR